MMMMMNEFELLSEGLSNVKLQQRRRGVEAQRRARLLDDKMRTIGVDKEFLDKQVAEKITRKRAEKEEQDAYDAATLDNLKRDSERRYQQLKVKREMEKAIVDYRHWHQKPGGKQEFDPEGSRGGKMQMMMLPGLPGEDLDSRTRVQRQREQLRDWLIQQQEDQAAEKHRQKMEKQRDDQSRVDMDNEALQLQRKELDRRKAETVATQEWNLNTMTKAEERRRQERTQKDIWQQGLHAGTMGAPGFCPSSDRKPPPESLMQITQFHKHQIEEKTRAELEEKREEMRHSTSRLDRARTAVLLERQQARRRKQLRRHMDTTNKDLATSQAQRKDDIERGHIDESFFAQFNTSSR
ncbi:RIB43A-like with coiled-coils protein 2 [Syngnathoides biaculeatus]|uniref:RIB43A-like with coiled-coils protein 2 n=1 Tax=Syngnathoides biaculeatus TaxID=300417 RepID=UPI002ADE0311|nr:RIB43A-like with coiled-coils protein 2 [Syngnathoides biaculeatus]